IGGLVCVTLFSGDASQVHYSSPTASDHVRTKILTYQKATVDIDSKSILPLLISCLSQRRFWSLNPSGIHNNIYHLSSGLYIVEHIGDLCFVGNVALKICSRCHINREHLYPSFAQNISTCRADSSITASNQC